MGSVKDRNGTDLTEAEDIKKRWQEYTEEIYKKKIFMTQITTHLEPDILEYEVKWALGSIATNKTSGDDRISVELFQILKMMVLKCCTQYASKAGKLSSGHITPQISVEFYSEPGAPPGLGVTAMSKRKIPASMQCIFYCHLELSSRKN